jgi:hypothetical protein
LVCILLIAGIVCPHAAFAQIDPVKRELIQFGYNQSLIGSSPISAYAFYYYNRPDFLDNTNLTLRMAVAPVYMDSELGILHALGPNTHLGFGLAGGGFADSYYEVRQGDYLKAESFNGDGVTGAASIYHLFNPGHRIPLNGLLRVETHYAAYNRDDDTARSFVLPPNQPEFNVRAGFRFGGKEPVMLPDLAMELSAWYVGQFRLDPGDYGFNNDRHVNAVSHQVWARALLDYTFESKQSFQVSITAGDTAKADRFSAYRLGGFLPLAAEFPLSLPGYFYQELSATRFALFNASYSVPIDPQKRFAVMGIASGALVQYLPGLEQPGHWNSGVGAGISYHSSSGAWQILVDYGYGFQAIRDSGRGGQTVGLLFQLNLERTHPQYVVPGADSGILRGLGNFSRSIF